MDVQRTAAKKGFSVNCAKTVPEAPEAPLLLVVNCFTSSWRGVLGSMKDVKSSERHHTKNNARGPKRKLPQNATLWLQLPQRISAQNEKAA